MSYHRNAIRVIEILWQQIEATTADSPSEFPFFHRLNFAPTTRPLERIYGQDVYRAATFAKKIFYSAFLAPTRLLGACQAKRHRDRLSSPVMIRGIQDRIEKAGGCCRHFVACFRGCLWFHGLTPMATCYHRSAVTQVDSGCGYSGEFRLWLPGWI